MLAYIKSISRLSGQLPSLRTIQKQESADALLAMANRCYRLAMGITDRKTIERLLEMAKECEDRANALRRDE